MDLHQGSSEKPSKEARADIVASCQGDNGQAVWKNRRWKREKAQIKVGGRRRLPQFYFELLLFP